MLKQILALWPCPHGEKRSISATHANAVDLGLGLQGPGSGQRLLPKSDSRLRAFINSASHSGFPNERRKEALSATLKAEASEFRLMQEAPFVSISESQRAPLPGLNWLATIHYGPLDLLELCEQPRGKGLFCRQPGIDLIYERTTACECGLNVGHDCTLSNAYMGLTMVAEGAGDSSIGGVGWTH